MALKPLTSPSAYPYVRRGRRNKFLSVSDFIIHFSAFYEDGKKIEHNERIKLVKENKKSKYREYLLFLCSFGYAAGSMGAAFASSSVGESSGV